MRLYTYAKHKFIDYNLKTAQELSKMKTPASEANLYQLPKGHKKLTKETKLTCALREFEEETGINRSAINIYPDLNFTQKYIDDGVTYCTTFYLGLLKDYKTPYFVTSHEVENVLDMTLEEVNVICRISGKQSELFKQLAVQAFKKINDIIKFKITDDIKL
jgi:8-oxo-dGTP pyrophosphatase MutT (NUDIX family)